MVEEDKKPTWREIPMGGVILEAGSATQYKTGEWRAERPIFNDERCTDCMLCFIFCPDSSIVVKDREMVGIDYEHCKGCGICARECPRDAIKMELESNYLE